MQFDIKGCFGLFFSKIIISLGLCSPPPFSKCTKVLDRLTLSSIYTHFDTWKKKKKKVLENIVEKGEIAQNEQFHLFPQCFLRHL